jgi:WD40 repeat protein
MTTRTTFPPTHERLALKAEFLFWFCLLTTVVLPPRTAAQLSSGAGPSIYLQTTHSEAFDSLVVSGNGQYAASRDNHGAIFVWDVRRRLQINRIDSGLGNNIVAFTPDNKYLSYVSGSTLLLRSLDGKGDRTLAIDPNLTSYSFSPDGKWIAWGDLFGNVGLSSLIDNSPPKRLRYVEHPEMTLLNSVEVIQNAKKTGSVIAAVCFSQDSREIVVLTSGNTVFLYASLDAKPQTASLPSDFHFQTLSFASESRLLFAGLRTTDEGPIFFGSGNLTLLEPFKSSTPILDIPSERRGGMTFSREGDRIAVMFRNRESGSYTETTLRVWDLNPLREIQLPELSKLKLLETPFAFTENHDVLLTRGQPANQLVEVSVATDRKFDYDLSPLWPVQQLSFVSGYLNITRLNLSSLFRLSDGQIAYRFSQYGRVAISQNGKLIAKSETDGNNYLYGLDKKGDRIRTPVGKDSGAINISDNGAIVWTTDHGFGGSTYFWRPGDQNPSEICKSESAFTAKSVIAVAESGEYSAAACSDRTTRSHLTIMRNSDGTRAYDQPWGKPDDVPVEIRSIDFTRDGKTLAVVTFVGITLMSVSGPQKETVIEPQPNRLYELIKFSSVDDGFVTESWAPGTGDCVIDYRRSMNEPVIHIPCSGHVMSLASNGPLVAIGGADGTVRLVDTDDPSKEIRIIDSGVAGWVIATQDGLFDGTADALKWVGWKAAGDGHIVPLESFYNDYYTPGLLPDLASKQLPKAQVDVASIMQMPGLRKMLSDKEAHLDTRINGVYVCFREKPGAALGSEPTDRRQFLRSLDGFENGPNSACPYQKRLLLDPSEVPTFAARMAAWHPDATTTPWDNTLSDTSTAILHVLTVGISNYDHQTGFPSIPFAAPSAEAVAAFYEKASQSGAHHFASVKVWDGLYNGNATKDNIRMRLIKMSQEVKDIDVVLLYFAGHGEVDPESELFYFVPSDGNSADLRHTGFTTAMFADALRSFRSRRVMVMIDSCQSGGAIEALRRVGIIKAQIEMQRSKPTLTESTVRGNEVGIHIVAAALPLSYAVGAEDNRNSAFAEALLLGLNTRADLYTTRQIENYLMTELPEISGKHNRGYRQIPVISALGADFSLQP